MAGGIYKITSNSNPDRFYIGRTINFKNRFNNHLSCLRNKTHHSIILQNHFNKYGENDLQFKVIKEIDCIEKQKIEEQILISSKPFFNVSRSSLGGRGLINQYINKYNWQDNLEEFFLEIKSGSFYHLKLYFSLRFKKPTLNKKQINETFIKYGLA